MRTQVFSIFDSKAQLFLQPFYSQTTGTALRSFYEAANDENHVFSKHAGDYTLFHLGEFNEETGTHHNLKAKVDLGLAITQQLVTDTPLELMQGPPEDPNFTQLRKDVADGRRG